MSGQIIRSLTKNSLWLPEVFGIWDSIYNDTVWELRLTILFSSVAWYNIGYINWEPWMSQIFTRILRGFSLPIGKLQISPHKYSYLMYSISRWIIAMIGNRNHAKNATEACQYLSMLRPELIVPPIIEKLFASIDNTNEPHRFTSIMTCLTRITRQLVRQTACYSQGQTYVLPLIMSVLPGIDLNDFKKTSVTLEFLNTIFMLITCVDCSSAIHIRKDLTDIEKEVCLSTAKFGDFINEFLDRIFRMIRILSTDMSDAAVIIDEANMEDTTLESKLTSIMANIVQQCSSKIFQIIREKITDFVTHSYWSAKVRKIVASLVQAIVLGDPVETLKYLLPKTCDSINKIMNDAEGHGLLTDHKGDKELTWYLFLFSELVRARGDTLIIYRQMIILVFHRCIQIIHKGSYKAVASAAKHLLKSLTHIYMINTRWTGENIDGPYVDFLPIRVWGQPVDVDKFQVQFHIPGDDELDFVREFVETFIYIELDLLKETNSKLSNNERLRSLTIVHHIAMGCFRIVPRIGSPNVQNLVPTVVSYSSQSQAQYSMYSKEPKFRENLRLRLLIDIGKLLGQYFIDESFQTYSIDFVDILVANHSDDVASIKIAHKQFEMVEYGTFTEIDKQVALKLFELSINRYSEIRRQAQTELFSVLSRYRFSSQVIVDRITELLNASSEVDHDQIKVGYRCLSPRNVWFFSNPYLPRVVCNILSWRQQEMAMSFLCLLLQRYVPVPSSCIHTCIDLLVHDHIELRKYAIQSIAAICRLQKSPRIYVEKSLDEVLHETKKESSSVTMHDECHPGDRDDNLWVTIDCYKPPETQVEWEQTCFLDKTFHGYYTWPKMIKYSMNKRARYTQNDMPEQVAIIYNRFMDKNFLIQSTKLMISDEHTDEINPETLRHWNKCFKCTMEHEDPRRMYRLIDFMRTLINNRISSNTFNEISRWSLIQTLRMFQWRIPSIWCTIHEYARELLDHSFKPVREHIANVLSMSFSFNIRLFNGKSTRHPSINQCMDVICERLHQAIEIYEKTPLVSVYGQFVEIDPEASKALNLIETGRDFILVAEKI
ncbi:unnamed protein product [Rotaria sordida]|uniref:Uncharacterized protein n=1 Tax=Rotaria sordida TaxID=392033 RepID=A0A814GUE5_9BILA|nr:unnamed protein product [Rotaria sordida]